VPPNLQRFLPIMIVLLLLLFVLPSILHKKSSGPTAKSQSAQTLDAANLIDQAEQAYKQAQGRYTSHLSDLVSLRPRLGRDLANGLVVTLDAGTKGVSYLAQVESVNLSLVRARNGDKLVANSCVVIKSASGVACPTTP
jgi:hypothetical protein